jgi:hypothetical protein
MRFWDRLARPSSGEPGDAMIKSQALLVPALQSGASTVRAAFCNRPQSFADETIV